MTKHTPTPWVNNGEGIIVCNDGDVFTMSTTLLDDKEREANAAFIVKAVNCHDELVEALEIAYKNLSGYEKGSITGIKISAALTKAKGEA